MCCSQSTDTSDRYEQVSPVPGNHLPARPVQLPASNQQDAFSQGKDTIKGLDRHGGAGGPGGEGLKLSQCFRESIDFLRVESLQPPTSSH